jgi:hypothetical protein
MDSSWFRLCGADPTVYLAISKTDLEGSIQNPITYDEASLSAKAAGIISVNMVSARDEASLQSAMEQIITVIAMRREDAKYAKEHPPRCLIL